MPASPSGIQCDYICTPLGTPIDSAKNDRTLGACGSPPKIAVESVLVDVPFEDT